MNFRKALKQLQSLALMTVVLLSIQSSALSGNVIVVDSSNNSGTGSLRVAISNLASDGDTIRFSAALQGDTIRLSSEIVIDKDLAIVGLGENSTFISGNNGTRIFRINADDSVRIEHLTLFKGLATDSGGAILNRGTLWLANCLVRNNSAKFGGGIYTNNYADITNCTVRDNVASTGQGGGVYIAAGFFASAQSVYENNTSVSGGGAIAALGLCTLNFVTIDGNFSNRGGGIYAESSLIVNNSTISGNNANFGDGGGILNFGNAKITLCIVDNNRVNNAGFSGGGIFTDNSCLLLTSTVSNNHSNGNSGGIHNNERLTVISSTLHDNSASLSGGAVSSSNEVLFNSSTISGNTAGQSGGGIQNSGSAFFNRSTVAFNDAGSNGGGISSSSDTMELSNSIITNNTATQGKELYKSGGDILSLGYNLIREITTGLLNTGAGDVLGTSANPINALLSPLQNNGGSTLTHMPLCGSPAIDAGDTTDAPSTDQRGEPRIHGAGIDIGSVESQAEPIELDAVITNETSQGSADGSIELLVEGGTSPYFITWNTGDSTYFINELNSGNYGVTVEDISGCTATAVFHVGEPDGIDGVNVPVILLYPNPASEKISVINFSDFTEAVIFDAAGKTVEKFASLQTLAGKEISVISLPRGSYVMLLRGKNNEIIARGRFSIVR